MVKISPITKEALAQATAHILLAGIMLAMLAISQTIFNILMIFVVAGLLAEYAINQAGKLQWPVVTGTSPKKTDHTEDQVS